jgi:hypothetical protein
MPEWVQRSSQPESKLALFDSRLSRLRGAVKAGESVAHVGKAAENLRLAALSVIKAKLALIREYPARDPDGRESANLRQEDQRWRSLSAEAITEEYGKSAD